MVSKKTSIEKIFQIFSQNSKNNSVTRYRVEYIHRRNYYNALVFDKKFHVDISQPLQESVDSKHSSNDISIQRVKFSYQNIHSPLY